jgi:hypothetical protein
MREGCYNCGAPATTEEHSPPACFFPKGYDSGLMTVPSCDEHNTHVSKDVEYVRNIICGQRGVNLVASRVFESADHSYSNSPSLFKRTFADVRTVVVDGEETGAFPIELPRFKRVIKAVAFAMYYHDFGQRNQGDFAVFSPSLKSRSNLYHGKPDGFENLRSILEVSAFKSMPVPQPKVFKYEISRPGEGQIQYKFEFYEAFSVCALTLPHRLSPMIYLPVTRDLTVFRLAQE